MRRQLWRILDHEIWDEPFYGTFLKVLIFAGIPIFLIIVGIQFLGWYMDTYDEDYWRYKYEQSSEKMYDCATQHQNLVVGQHGRDIPTRYSYEECAKFEDDANKYSQKLYDGKKFRYDWEPEGDLRNYYQPE